jgi:Double zinc ribbon/Adenylate and Guanylate cyclase catalytic domain
MLCAKCNSDIPSDAVFCMRCGAKVEIGCPSCRTLNPADANFCTKCGASLGAAGPIRPVTQLRDDLAGERRHLTVLFCDLVGSTEIANHLDPEAWREIVGEYHRAAAQAIERFGGNVAQYLGDGVMAYFGWPEAHDNDAERAARAGLAILEAITKLKEHPARQTRRARWDRFRHGGRWRGCWERHRRIRRYSQYCCARTGSRRSGNGTGKRRCASVGIRAFRRRRSRSAGA